MRVVQVGIVSYLKEVLKPGDVLCLPTSHRVALLKNMVYSGAEVAYRYQPRNLLCVASLGGLPETSLPLAKVDGLSLGLSIIGAAGIDGQLLDLACAIAKG